MPGSAKQSYAFSDTSSVDGGADPVALVESRIVALIISIIDFNPTYFEDDETMKKLTKLINIFDATDKVVCHLVSYFLFSFYFPSFSISLLTL
jgi:hypothetical protein